MAAISPNAIAAPANAAVSAKPGANDAGKPPADGSPFAVVLAQTSSTQQPAQTSSSGNNSSDAQSGAAQSDSKNQAPASSAQTQASASNTPPNADNAAADASAAKTQANGQTAAAAQAQLQAATDASNETTNAPAASGKPPAKGNKPANGNAAATAQPQQQNAADPNVAAQTAAQMAAAQMTAAQITTPQAPQQAAANDDAPDDEDNGTVTGAAKPGTRTAPQAPSSAAASDPANPAPSRSATPQSAAAAAQAAIQGAGKNANSNNTSANAAGDNTSGPDKPAKTADNNAAPQVQPQQAQQQPQPPQAPATSTAVSAIPANTMPVQAGGTHNVAAAVQVQAQSAAQPTPDVNSLAVSIAARSQGGAKEFTIRLDPPELGRVDVRLSIDATGKTEAHLTADQPETLNLLQKDSGTLTQALRNSGLDVSQSGLNFSLRGQNSQAGNDNGGQARSPRSSLAATQVLDAAQSASSITYTGGGDQTRLDIHV